MSFIWTIFLVEIFFNCYSLQAEYNQLLFDNLSNDDLNYAPNVNITDNKVKDNILKKQDFDFKIDPKNETYSTIKENDFPSLKSLNSTNFNINDNNLSIIDTVNSDFTLNNGTILKFFHKLNTKHKRESNSGIQNYKEVKDKAVPIINMMNNNTNGIFMDNLNVIGNNTNSQNYSDIDYKHQTDIIKGDLTIKETNKSDNLSKNDPEVISKNTSNVMSKNFYNVIGKIDSNVMSKNEFDVIAKNDMSKRNTGPITKNKSGSDNISKNDYDVNINTNTDAFSKRNFDIINKIDSDTIVKNDSDVNSKNDSETSIKKDSDVISKNGSVDR
uniref:Uncharacterized protein n=1 Tax=Cacopsylla melanoneura TaxID=428564 RepID=A0A8D9ART5_9HEMI